MFHPDVDDGVIVKEAGTMHGIDRDTPMSQCYSKVRPILLHEGHSQGSSNLSKDTYEYVDLEDEPISGHFHSNIAGSEDDLHMSSQIS